MDLADAPLAERWETDELARTEFGQTLMSRWRCRERPDQRSLLKRRSLNPGGTSNACPSPINLTILFVPSRTALQLLHTAKWASIRARNSGSTTPSRKFEICRRTSGRLRPDTRMDRSQAQLFRHNTESLMLTDYEPDWNTGNLTDREIYAAIRYLEPDPRRTGQQRADDQDKDKAAIGSTNPAQSSDHSAAVPVVICLCLYIVLFAFLWFSSR